MRAITIMYDSLIRKHLSPYGGKAITPNFQRLAEKCTCFDNFYCGSLPCMPARREMHTGRHNFLHRSWGPLEPYDDSMSEILSKTGIHTHLISDHCHYWQDGGLNYHTKFTTYDFIRGKEGDGWKPLVKDFAGNNNHVVQDKINRQFMKDEENHNHVRGYLSAMEFLKNNVMEDNWYLQLEYFDPHEPFFVPEKYKKMYSEHLGENDWPPYAEVGEIKPEVTNEFNLNYFALLTMCDDYLGKILDYMDKNNMWEDTLLIVNTDHGFLLGEHGYFAKNYMPSFDELVHLPFFMHVPGKETQKRNNVVSQTIDIPATILEHFGIEKPKDMLGKSLIETSTNNKPVRKTGIFGYFGKHINITDGKHVYMRSARSEDNQPLHNYTLMPQHLMQNFSMDELKGCDRTMVDDFQFTKGIPLIRYPASDEITPKKSMFKFMDHIQQGDFLFDLEKDPLQKDNLAATFNVTDFEREMILHLKENDAPKEQYLRMGLEEK